jgi:ribosomal protein L3 glutamine methyltransferase
MAALMNPASCLSLRLTRGADVPHVIEAVQRFFAGHELFFGHGTANARDEAAWLVAAVLDWREDWVQLKPTAAQLSRIAALAGQRVTQRRPLAYLLHEGWLAGLKFYVDERVLVPRSPLAELIQRQLAPWVDGAGVQRALDVGTGSGCLAIALAHFLPHVRVDATDTDPAALRVARSNVSRHRVGDRVRVLRSDLFGALAGQRYQVILTNPPYVPAARMQALPAEYGHEPSTALTAGDDGLDLARRILRQAGAYLTAGGVLFMEVGEAADALLGAYPRVPFTWLELAEGGEGVIQLTADQLNEYFPANGNRAR